MRLEVEEVFIGNDARTMVQKTSTQRDNNFQDKIRAYLACTSLDVIPFDLNVLTVLLVLFYKQLRIEFGQFLSL